LWSALGLKSEIKLLKPENLKNHVAGDIAGILLPKRDCNDNELESINYINNELQVFYPKRLKDKDKFLDHA
jgi:hypothetical protein